MKAPFLEGNSIYLKDLSIEDITDEYVQWLNEPVVCSFNAHARFPNNAEKTKKYVEETNSSKLVILFAIYDKKKDIHIGNICLNKIDWVNRSAEIAIIIGNKNYWGKGVGTEAYKLVIKYAFDVLNLHRLYSGMAKVNVGMVKVAEKVGMKKEGMAKEALFKNGKYLDVVLYGILNPRN